jgi:hypothetical protein
MSRWSRWITADVAAILVLMLLWALFFWRLLTPVIADQASIEKGDFSGQFVAFAAYQYQRFSAGEVPLWNPYNNGGLPFIGDTQAAVFYPPRLLTITLSKMAGGFSYHALELEMIAHVLLGSLLMYAFARRLTRTSAGSVPAAFIAALIFSYGGFMGSYPPLQVALLEAAIWLPLALLGLHEATQEGRFRPAWLALTAFAFGLSWLAGHPQTSFFQTYLLVAYLGYRAYEQRLGWRPFLMGTLAFGILGGGLAAVQLLPGFEYLSHTARTAMGFDAKGNGFPLQDAVQFVFPGVVSLWSPLYVGLIGLTLAGIALWRQVPHSRFWGGVALFAFGLSLGAHTPLFAALYNALPGLRFFRGQERAAYLISFGLALLAGLGAAHLASWDKLKDYQATLKIRRVLRVFAIVCAAAFGLLLVAWMGNQEAYGTILGTGAFVMLSALGAVLAIPYLLDAPDKPLRWILLGSMLALELFTVSMDRPSNYDSIPPDQQLSFQPPPLIQTALADTDQPFRVDGYRALHDNYGSLYGLADMRGISPLFLERTFALIEPNLINPLAWELFAVRYVYTDWQEMPIPSEIIASGDDRYGTVNLHRLTHPRPFALLVYNTEVIADAQAARQRLADATFNARQTMLLEQPPTTPPGSPSADDRAEGTQFAPESFTIAVNAAGNAILSVATPYYPGWTAELDGKPAPILRAYSALSAVEVPAGQHTLIFRYDPLSYRAGALISLACWIGLGAFGIVQFIRSRNRHARR